MRLSRILLLIAAAMAVCLVSFAAGRVAGGLARPHAAASAGIREDVLNLLATHYYRTVDPRLLDGRSLRALPRALGDPYTEVLDPARVGKRDRMRPGDTPASACSSLGRQGASASTACARGGPL